MSESKQAGVAEGGDSSRSSSLDEEAKTNKKIFRRVVWIILLLIVAGGFAYHFYTLLSGYLTYAKFTNTAIAHSPSPFPKVSICAVGSFSRARFWNLYGLFTTKSYNVPGTKLNWMTDIYLKSMMTFWRLALTGNKTYSELTKSDNKTIYLAASRAMIPQLAKVPIASTPLEVIARCSYNGQVCDYRNFTTVYLGPESACFQFRDPSNGTDSGSSRLDLYLSNIEFELLPYDPAIVGRKYVMEVYVNWHNQAIDLFNPVTTADPLKSISVKITPSSSYFLKTPVFQCSDPRALNVCVLHQDDGLQCQEVVETKSLCSQLAIQRDLARHCRCVSYEWPIPDDLHRLPMCHEVPSEVYLNKGYQINHVNGSSVTLINNTELLLDSVVNMSSILERHMCYMSRRGSWETIRADNQCPTLCETSQEITTVTSAENYLAFPDTQQTIWVSEAFLGKGLMETLNAAKAEGLEPPVLDKITTYQSLVGKDKLGATPTLYMMPYSFVRIERSTFTAENNTEDIRYSFPKFIAETGGTLGVWIGASVVTVFELIENIFQLILLFKKKRRKTNT